MASFIMHINWQEKPPSCRGHSKSITKKKKNKNCCDFKHCRIIAQVILFDANIKRFEYLDGCTTHSLIAPYFIMLELFLIIKLKFAV